eukprot:GHVU01022248.1.p1 GENE.GHVU01022248.1~~GHVU01022248.1.p1  ORF type:complete len:165 (+),score=6.62 GHVU01022248.1:334-828(+)
MCVCMYVCVRVLVCVYVCGCVCICLRVCVGSSLFSRISLTRVSPGCWRTRRSHSTRRRPHLTRSDSAADRQPPIDAPTTRSVRVFNMAKQERVMLALSAHGRGGPMMPPTGRWRYYLPVGTRYPPVDYVASLPVGQSAHGCSIGALERVRDLFSSLCTRPIAIE